MKNWPERQISFLVVWLTMFSCISANGQNLLKRMDPSPNFNHLWLPGTNTELWSSKTKLLGLGDHLALSWDVIFAQSMATGSLFAVPPDIYYSQSGIMCKMEWQVEKATHVPFRFRLGSLADCNAIEGKH